MFSTFLKTYHPDKADNYKKYKHSFPDGLVVDARRQYPNEMLHIFITYIDEYWIPNCAEKYFGDRDKLALDYLPKLLGA